MENAQIIAAKLGVEIQDGWFYVGNLIDVDGSPWVELETFLEIVEILGE